ncbi:hypothetical protein Aperf_G00000049059 [Anoplocephala perfoliata]
MPNFCGCTGESSISKLHWPWKKNSGPSTSSVNRRSTTLGESVDDTEVAKSPTLAKPEIDDTDSARNSIPHEPTKASRPPVTFELDNPTRDSGSDRDDYFHKRNHSLDIDTGIIPQSADSTSVVNRTFPTFFGSKSVRSSGRLYPNRNGIVLRRGSLLVRSGRPLLLSQQSSENSKVTSPGTAGAGTPSPSVADSHGTKERFLDESVIVTPFAQILASLRSVQSNIAWLTSQNQSSKPNTDSQIPRAFGDSDLPADAVVDYEALAEATKKELDWCLMQLENIQTKRPVSDMASTKFKRILSQKLGNFGSADKTRNQISEYIRTFTDEYSEQDDNIEEEGRSSSKALQTGSEGLENSRTDVAVFTLDSSACDVDRRSREIPESPMARNASAEDGIQADAGTNTENIPFLGIKTSNDEELMGGLDVSLDTWCMNMFDVDALTGQHALTVVTYRIFSKRGLFHAFSINPSTFVTYILRLEASYHSSNPYHNHIHAADVIQTVHVLLQAETLANVFSDIEILSSLFAAAIHDTNHPGLTNQFLVNTGHKLALLYNDASVLENHHLSVAFQLLTEPGCDIFENFSLKQKQFLRRLVIELVLATDMSKHMNLLAELRTMVETKELTGTEYLSLDDHNDRSLVLQCMLHCADLSTPTKPFEIYKRWTYGVMEEFFKQGDKEKELGIEISAMCDRDSVVVDKAQIGFIDFIVHPLWDTWCDLVHPAGEHILEALDANRDILLNQSPFKEFEKRAKEQGSQSTK